MFCLNEGYEEDEPSQSDSGKDFILLLFQALDFSFMLDICVSVVDQDLC